VTAHLAGDPDLDAKVMGILVGYGVPGNTYLDDTHPPMQGGGGWSISSNLIDLNSATWYRRTNPHHFAATYQTPHDRLTKATLTAGFYVTGRIDAPTLADAQALTTRARDITLATDALPASESIYYDYADPGAAGGDEWQPLENLVADDDFQDAVRYPFLAFESETDATPACAARLSYYRITGWQSVNWGGTPSGTRIFGYALNSFGATTVRSTTGLGGRYVPNALVNGGFAAAFGATAEPFVGREPQPGTVLWCLADGRTLAEASLHANPYVNYMWECVGDPLLRVPHWFGASPNSAPAAPAALGPDELIDGSDTTDLTPTLTFVQADDDGDALSFQLQIDDSADFASPLVDYTSADQAAGAASFTVGAGGWGGQLRRGDRRAASRCRRLLLAGAQHRRSDHGKLDLRQWRRRGVHRGSTCRRFFRSRCHRVGGRRIGHAHRRAVVRFRRNRAGQLRNVGRDRLGGRRLRGRYGHAGIRAGRYV
jgi:hypothetical protein